jgi:3-phosphoshikimate 1-carboxyvinyltransferase
MSELSFNRAKKLEGEIRLPGDKSLSHRASLFAALAEGESVIERFLVSGVTRMMLNALTSLHIPWSLTGDTLVVTGRGLQGFREPASPINCGNSATTIRLLAGALAASGTPCVLDGSEGLRKRPMGRITEPLMRMNVPITATLGCAPLHLMRRDAEHPLHAVDYTLPVASAQVKSCVILATLAADACSTIREPGPSRDHSERMLSAMGADIRWSSGVVEICPLTRALKPLHIALAGDISSAAFLLVAAAIVPGSSICIREVGLNPTRTGILDALRKMGALITIDNARMVAGEPVGDIHLVSNALKAITVSGDLVVRMIDEFPAFAIAACYAEGVTVVRDARELRYKETDRIDILCGELRKLGVQLEMYDDGFAIHGKTLKGGVVDGAGDHRIAMSLAVAGLASPEPVIVQHAEILNESFPDFVTRIHALCGQQK